MDHNSSAIWSDYAKQVMKDLAESAGMIDNTVENHLIVAYEPDVMHSFLLSLLSCLILNKNKTVRVHFNPTRT